MPIVHKESIAANNLPGRGRSAYLDLALIFLLFRFSLLILFFLHLALIALNHLWNKPDVTKGPQEVIIGLRS